ncbi:hypothetical protein FD04_GL001077 [Secundilactobacillus odoratitofui DSM 19909 = JCM 15043]|uniref:SCP domain-containing protein n=1 Tax=Secundilactobacillus odoratitofui DSM 19909 = JCM 15043 TaxID=1423776 RepID=A0A0R1LWU7_9LACO|nr:CAP domain-containing protein [Secundilactobacillus odoratitofui]KRK98099.1 hypothetical protein FD04_GL001077 [Secundilactobacillus odoratitofui DSM 19909 = JCM 15043]
MNKKILGGVTLAIFSGLLFSAVIEFLPNNITRTSTSASAKTKVRYYQNIKNATYMVRNKKAVIYSNGKINHKTGAKLGAYGTYVTGYYASHVTINGKKSVYYKFKTDSGHTGWVWNGWLKKVSYKTPAKSGSNNTPKTPINASSDWNTDSNDDSFKFSNQAYVNEFVVKLNKERTKRNLQPVSVDAQLTQITNKRIKDITQNFTHYNSAGKPIFAEYAKQLGITTARAEVLAYSMPSTINVDTPTSKDAADNDVIEYIYYDGNSDWGHRDALLNPKYNIIGVTATYTHEDVYDATVLGVR